MCAVKETIEEGFAFVGGTKATAEVTDGIVVVQGQCMQELLQFLEAFAELRWIGFMRICIREV